MTDHNDAEYGKQIIDSGRYKPAAAARYSDNGDATYDDWQPSDDDIPPPPDDDGGDDAPTTWEPIDLGPWLRGEVEQPQPSIGVHRSDGLRLIYPGREHAVARRNRKRQNMVRAGVRRRRTVTRKPRRVYPLRGRRPRQHHRTPPATRRRRRRDH